MLSFMPIKRVYRIAALCATICAASSAQSYKLSGSIKLGGEGGWDYLTADSDNARLYVSHAGEVQVIDLHTDKSVGSITGMKRIHGIALAPDLDAGFISDGGSNQVDKFDLKTLVKKGVAETGTNPDGIVYELLRNGSSPSTDAARTLPSSMLQPIRSSAQSPWVASRSFL